MSIVNGVTGRKPMAEEVHGLEHICALVQSSTGIQLGSEKHVMVRSRLTKRLRTLGLSSLGEYVTLLKRATTRDEMTQLIDLLTTNKTSFYREPRHFEVLADLYSEVAGSGEQPCIWSAGCSSGEEPYTMALTALRSGVQPRILATDISTRVLAEAKAASYDAATVADIPSAIRQAYLAGSNGMYQVGAAARAFISFASLNLLGPWPMRGPFHAIFCRNVMIYFDKPTRERLVARYRELLAPNGLLFVGLSESLTGLKHDYRLLEPGVYAR